MEYNLYYSVSNKTSDDIIYISCILYKDSTDGLPWLKELIEYKCESNKKGSDLFFIGLMKATEWLCRLYDGRLIGSIGNKIIINSSYHQMLKSIKKQDFTNNEKEIIRRLKVSHKRLEKVFDVYYREIGKADNLSYLYLRRLHTKKNLLKVKSSDYELKKTNRKRKSKNKIQRWEVKI